MAKSKGFTLIELMVVIVIIGILSALAIPKMFGVSAKAKAAEAPGVLANWGTLQSAYAQETGTAGIFATIGFQNPSGASKWFNYTDQTVAGAGAGQITATVDMAFGECPAAAATAFISMFTVATDVEVHSSTAPALCQAYIPNFLP